MVFKRFSFYRNNNDIFNSLHTTSFKNVKMRSWKGAKETMWYYNTII